MSLQVALVVASLGITTPYATNQQCIDAQIPYIEKNIEASCNYVLPNGGIVPRGMEPYQDQDGTWLVRPFTEHAVVVIRPTPTFYRPDIVIQVQD